MTDPEVDDLLARLDAAQNAGADFRAHITKLEASLAVERAARKALYDAAVEHLRLMMSPDHTWEERQSASAFLAVHFGCTHGDK